MAKMMSLCLSLYGQNLDIECWSIDEYSFSYLYLFIYYIFSRNSEYSKDPVIARLQENMPAKQIGMLPGDKVIKIENEYISTWKDMTTIIC